MRRTLRQYREWLATALCAGLLVWTSGCKEKNATQCGDDLCNIGETCFNCPNDCGVCVGDICGDGECGTTEYCDT